MNRRAAVDLPSLHLAESWGSCDHGIKLNKLFL